MFYKIKMFFGHIIAYFAMQSMISSARASFRKDGQRRFVIPFHDGTMEVLTKKEAIALKKEGHLAADLTMKTIYNACYFFTDTTVAHERIQGEMPKRELKRRLKAYYPWYDRHHKNCI